MWWGSSARQGSQPAARRRAARSASPAARPTWARTSRGGRFDEIDGRASVRRRFGDGLGQTRQGPRRGNIDARQVGHDPIIGRRRKIARRDLPRLGIIRGRRHRGPGIGRRRDLGAPGTCGRREDCEHNPPRTRTQPLDEHAHRPAYPPSDPNASISKACRRLVQRHLRRRRRQSPMGRPNVGHAAASPRISVSSPISFIFR